MHQDLASSNDTGLFDLQPICLQLAGLSPHAIAAVDPVLHHVRYLNPAFCRMLGKPVEDLMEHPLAELLSDLPDLDSVVKRVLSTEQAEFRNEIERPGQQVSYWSYIFWPIIDANSKPLGVLVQVSDATEIAIFRKRSMEMNQSLLVSALQQHELNEKAQKLNDELQAATQAKNQFLASMSHEIRTPLNAIMGFSEFLTIPGTSEEDRQMYGERIKRNGQLLLRLIEDILDLSKVEAGKLDIENIDVNLESLLSDVEVLMRHQAETKRIQFSVTRDGPLPPRILSDPTRLRQILTNIIGNSIKFTSAGSVNVNVSVSTGINGRKLRFLVKDTGRGMSPEELSKIFQPFTQGDSTTTRKFGGTGLGLDLSRRLATALGGDVVLVSSEKDRGSVFEITVGMVEPQDQKAFPRQSRPASVANCPRLDGLKVLVADDASDNRLLIGRYLTSVGAKFDLAKDGEEAVEKALSTHYDIVLMDIQMPGMDGYTATRKLREKGFKDPVVALTAHAMRGEVERCHSAGCDKHLSKPVARKDLVETIYLMTQKHLGHTDTRPLH